ncbi:hypothetical protein SDC9_143722 [bioreactor metagenome]|uniref:Uncharacterized protein n=1 Tax=bioreactor metagenome TaxID=1076179 RepID=A0A645E592_9ZZZZ
MFRLVHEVGGDHNGGTLRGEIIDDVPEEQARLGVDAARRLVEKEYLRLVEDGAAEGEPLPPAARERRGGFVLTPHKSRELDHFVDTPLFLRALKPVESRVEVEVFQDGELRVEREFLRHVADFFFQFLSVGGQVKAKDEPLARGGREQAAEHADGRRFPRAVWAEEAVDLPLLNGHIYAVDGGEAAEFFRQVFRAHHYGGHVSSPFPQRRRRGLQVPVRCRGSPAAGCRVL